MEGAGDRGGPEQAAFERKFEFPVEREVYLATLSRLFFPGSYRRAMARARDYRISGAEGLSLHHLYRAMSFLGDNRERMEDDLFFRNRDLFSSLSLVFFDTTTLYFEGGGGDRLGRRGYSKDRRPDENQTVLGMVLDDRGRPIACPTWPGNTTDASTILPVAESLRSRFGVEGICIVADRGMMGKKERARAGKAGICLHPRDEDAPGEEGHGGDPFPPRAPPGGDR